MSHRNRGVSSQSQSSEAQARRAKAKRAARRKLGVAVQTIFEQLERRTLLSVSAGSLDAANFNTVGKVITDFGGAEDNGNSVAIVTNNPLANGDIVVGGVSNGDFAVALYSSGGSLLASTTTPIGSGYSQANAVTMDSNGNIVVAGYTVNPVSNDDIAVARYKIVSSGGGGGLAVQLDTSFNGTGVVTTDIGGSKKADVANAVAIDGSGNIIVAGQSGTHALIASYSNVGGLNWDTLSAGKDDLNGVVVESGGNILAVGHNATHAETIALTGAGAITGTNTLNLGTNDNLTSVAAGPNGEYIVGGTANGEFVVAEVVAAGTLDSSFGTSGETTTSFGAGSSRSQANSVAISDVNGNEKIYLAGMETDIASGEDFFALARYDADGTLDSAFGTSGTTTTDFTVGADATANSDAAGITITPDGKLIVAGTTDASASGTDAQLDNFAVASYVSNNAPTSTNATAALDAVNEDDDASAGTSVATLVTRFGMTDSDGDTVGLAVTGVGDTYGTWQYFTGSSWTNVPVSVGDTNALTLAPTALVRFQPATGDTGTSSISVRAWDQTKGSNGSFSNVTANAAANYNSFSGNTYTASIFVTPTTPPPVVYVDAAWTGTVGSTVTDGFGQHTLGVDAFTTIQGGVDAVASGGIVEVDAGSYSENVTIDQPMSIDGAGQASVTVYPGSVGISSDDLGGSTVFLIESSDVTIQNLTVNGANPDLSGGTEVGGASVDATTGIITDWDGPTSFTGITVKDVTVENVYLRGIEYADGEDFGTGTTDFENDTVTNVQGDPDNSIAIFSFGGNGIIENNTVSDTPTAISTNWSFGTEISGNIITNAGTGIHSDNNGGAGGTADSIDNNNVSLGQAGGGTYGIFVFSPYLNATVQSNTVSGVDVGLADFGGSGGSAAFSDNTVSVNAVGTGALVTTDQLGFGQGDVSASFDGDGFTGGATGIQLQQNAGATASVSITGVTVDDPTVGIDINGGTATIDGNTIYNNTTGIEFTGGASGSFADNDFDNATAGPANGTDLDIDSTAGAVIDGGGNLFAGSQYIDDYVFADTLNASSDTFSGTPAGSLSLSGAFSVEDRISDYLDSPAYGYVELNATNVYVSQKSDQTNNGAVQRGVNVAPSSGTVNVQAGVFVGEVDIETSLTLAGAQYGIDPNTSAPAPDAQTFIEPDTGDANPNDGGAIELVYVGVGDVTIDGVTVDGSNSLLPTNGNTPTFDGVNIDAAEGIVSYNGVGNITVRNNIVENTAYTGVDFYNYVNGGDATSDNTITDNLIQNLSDAYGFGVGVLLYNNFYAQVTDNVIQNVTVGVQTGNFSNINSHVGFAPKISDNTISASGVGIFYNLMYDSSSAFTVADNNITAIYAPSDAPWQGILITSLQIDVNVTFQGNTIDGSAAYTSGTDPSSGYGVWNTPTTGSVLISGGSVTGVDYGVWLNTYETFDGNADDTQATISDVNITATQIGVYVEDSPENGVATVTATIEDGTSISTGGTGTGVLVSGSTASASISDSSIDDPTIGIDIEGGGTASINNNIFSGNSLDLKVGSGSTVSSLTDNTFTGTQFIDDNSAPGNVIDATTDTFDVGPGSTQVAGSALSVAEGFAVEDRVTDYLDNPAYGYVELNATNVYVTPLSDTINGAIQRGINVAPSGGIVNLEAGTYVANGDTLVSGPAVGAAGSEIALLNIDKSITLLGPNASYAPSSPSSLPSNAQAVIVPGSSDSNPYDTTAIILVLVNASNVSIEGVTVDGINSALVGPHYSDPGTDTYGYGPANPHVGPVTANSPNAIDVSEDIASYTNVGNITIQGDIVENAGFIGVDFNNGTDYSGGTTTDNTITDNLIQNISDAYGYGDGINIYDNFYAAITHNVIYNVYAGVQIGNFSRPDSVLDTNTPSISDNQITAGNTGIFYNLSYDSASSLAVSGNDIYAVNNPLYTTWYGVLAATDGQYVNFDNNTIDGSGANAATQTVGYDVWNTPGSIITDGTVSNVQYGVWVNSYEGFLSPGGPSSITVDGASISASITGVYVEDSSVAFPSAFTGTPPAVSATIDGNTDITTGGAGTGILVSGPNASAIISGNDSSIHGNNIGIDVTGGTATITDNHIYDNTTGIKFTSTGSGSVTGNNFAGTTDNGTDLDIDTSAGAVTIGDGNAFNATGNYIDNESSQVFDLSGYTTTTFSGFNAATSAVTGNLATFYGVENQIVDYLDNGTSGYVRIKSGYDFVTQQDETDLSGAIQRGINVANTDESSVPTNGDTVDVQAGTFNESPQVTKSLTLSGAGEGLTTINLLPDGSVGTPYLAPLYIAAPDGTVTVEGFTIVGNDAVGSGLANSDIYLETALAQGLNKVTIENNQIESGQVGSGTTGDDGMGLITAYATDPTQFVGTLDVSNNAFTPTDSNGSFCAFYINTGVDNFNFTGNTVTGNFGSDAITEANTALIQGNTVTGVGAAGSRTPGFGAYGDTDATTFGHASFIGNTFNNVSWGVALYSANDGVVENNLFTNDDIGVWVNDAGAPGFDPSTDSVTDNSFDLTNAIGFENDTAVSVSAANNWWGNANGPTSSLNTYGVGSQGSEETGPAVIAPWLTNGQNNPPAPPGFYPTPGFTFAPIEDITQGTFFGSIQAAVNASSPGDTISIGPGTYNENVTVPDSITIDGAGDGSNPATNTVVESDNSNSPVFDITGSGTSVTLENLYITGGSVGKSSGVDVEAGASVGMSHVTINDPAVGVDVSGSANIDDDTISGNGIGVKVESTGTADISGSAIVDNPQDGITSAGDLTVENNSSISDSSTGIQITGGTAIIEDSSVGSASGVAGNGVGIQVSGGTVSVHDGNMVGNHKDVMEISAGSLTVDQGSSITVATGYDGINATGGTVDVTGATTEITAAGGATDTTGVQLGGSAGATIDGGVTISDLSVGVLDANGNPVPNTIVIGDTTNGGNNFTDNGVALDVNGDGILDLTDNVLRGTAGGVGIEDDSTGTLTSTGDSISGASGNLLADGITVASGATADVNSATIEYAAFGVDVAAGGAADIQGSTVSYNGIGVRSSGTLTIVNGVCKSTNYAASSIGVQENAGTAIIETSTINNYSDGIQVTGGTATISGNTMSGNGTAIDLNGDGIPDLTDNIITGGAGQIGIDDESTGTLTSTGDSISGTHGNDLADAIIVGSGDTADFRSATIEYGVIGADVASGGTAEIQGSTVSYNGIGAESSGTLTLDDNFCHTVVYSGTALGVQVNAGTALIENSQINNYSDGIQVNGGTATISGNTMTGNGTAVDVEDAGAAGLTDNTITGGQIGLDDNSTGTVTSTGDQIAGSLGADTTDDVRIRKGSVSLSADELGFTVTGIDDDGTVHISNTTISDATTGVTAEADASTVSISDGSEIESSTTGLEVAGGAVTVDDSTITGGTTGVLVEAGQSATVQNGSTISDAATGIDNEGGTVNVENSTISGDIDGVRNDSETGISSISFVNSALSNNATGITFTGVDASASLDATSTINLPTDGVGVLFDAASGTDTLTGGTISDILSATNTVGIVAGGSGHSFISRVSLLKPTTAVEVSGLATLTDDSITQNNVGVVVESTGDAIIGAGGFGNDISDNTTDGIDFTAGSTGTVDNNFIQGNSTGVLIATGAGTVGPISDNSISGNTSSGVENDSTQTIDATANWWGSATGPTVSSNTGGTGDAILGSNVLYSPWLTSGTDADGIRTDGFQPQSGAQVQISGNSSVFEGNTYTLNLNPSNPGSPDITGWVINWGDGTISNPDTQTVTGDPATVTHVFDEGSFTISATATTTSGPATSNTVGVTVIDAPLTNTSSVVAYNAIEGVSTGSQILATFTDGNPLAPLSDYTPIVTWGGTLIGTPSATVQLVSRTGSASNWEVLGSATYATDGTYNVSVTVNDAGGSTISSSGKTSFVVADAVPTVALSGSFSDISNPTPNVAEGSTFTLTLAPVVDTGYAGGDRVEDYFINWGDGSAEQEVPVATIPQLTGGTVTHVYESGEAGSVVPQGTTTPNAPIQVDLLTTDTYFAGAGSLGVVVYDVPPTASFSGSSTVQEGNTGSVTFFNQSDPGTLTQYFYSYDFNDSGNFSAPGDIVNSSSASVTVPASFLSTPGVVTVRGRISDQSGGFTDYLHQITVTNIAPSVASMSNVNTTTGTAWTENGSFTDPGSDSPWLVYANYNYDPINNPGLGTLIQSGSSKNFTLGTTYASTGTYTVRVTVQDLNDGALSLAGTGTFTVNVTPSTFHVTNFTQTTTGFNVQFNRAANLNVLNLYSGPSVEYGRPDVTLTGPNGPVTGSLVWNASSDTASFVQTGSILAPGNYTATLVSGAGSWEDTSDNALQSNDPSGNYVANFTVSAPNDVLSLPYFSRGPGQAINLPATSTSGIPITLSDGTGVDAVDFDLTYNPALLTITNVVPGANFPGSGWSITANNTVPGDLQVTVSGTSTLGSGSKALVDIIAHVPTTATYGAGEELSITNLVINGGAIAGTADSVACKVALIGDAAGLGFYDPYSSYLISNVVVHNTTGFDAYPLIDPVIVGNVTGSGSLSGQDAADVAQESVGLNVPQIPAIPGGFTPPASPVGPGVDPLVSIPSDILGSPGTTINVPIDIDDATQLDSGAFTIGYNSSELSLTGATAGSLDPSWSVIEANNKVAIFNTGDTQPPAGSGSIVDLTFTVLANASLGVTPVTIAGGDLNGGLLTMTTAPGSVLVHAPVILSDNIDYVRLDNNGQDIDIWHNATASGLPAESIELDGIDSLTYTGPAGGDLFILDLSNGQPLPASGLSFTGGSGQNTLEVIGTTGNDNATVGASSFNVTSPDGSDSISYASANALIFDGDASGTDTLTQAAQPGGGATLAFSRPTSQDTLNVNAGTFTVPASAPGGGNLDYTLGTASVAPGAKLVLSPSDVLADQTLFTVNTLSDSGTMDITNNTVYVDYGNGNPSPIANIKSLVTTGYNGGAWNGTGITSSSVASQPPHTYGVGYADGADGVVHGLLPGQIEITPALVGDANLDGKVNFTDFQLLSANFPQANTSWDQGDFNYANVTNFIDFQLLSSNFGRNSALAVTSNNSAAIVSAAEVAPAVTPAPVATVPSSAAAAPATAPAEAVAPVTSTVEAVAAATPAIGGATLFSDQPIAATWDNGLDDLLGE